MSISNRPWDSVCVDVSSSGNTTILAGVAGQSFTVGRLKLSAAGAVKVVLKSGSVAMTCLIFGANADRDEQFDHDLGLFTTAPGQDLVINLDGAVNVTGHLNYWKS